MASNSTQTIVIPDLGGAEGVEVIEIAVAVGDTIAVDDELIVLESDKASMEIPSSHAGTITAIHVTVGDQVNEGDALVELELTEAAETGKEESEEQAEPSSPKQQETAPEQSAASMETVETVEVKVPDIGSESAEVIEVLIQAGDKIVAEDSLIALESDKASMEVPAPVSGTVLEVQVKVGDTLSEGDVIAVVEAHLSAQPETQTVSETQKPPLSSEPQPKQATNKPVAAQSTTVMPATDLKEVYAGPAVRKLARELGVDLTQVRATGPRGRLQKDDLHNYIREALSKAREGGGAIPAVPAVDFAKFGEVELVPMSKIDKVTAANMQRSWLNVPHVTQFDEADLSVVDQLRNDWKAQAEQREIKLTPLAFLLKVCALALLEHPKLNSSLHHDQEHFVRKKYVHIGMAVDTPKGLMVPVIRDVDKKDLWQLAQEVIELAEKARQGKLKPADMQGGCFSISSLGAIGGQGFTPVVNTPEVAILGVSKATIKPLWNGEAFMPGKMLPLSLSYDHRVINGADAGRFLTFIVDALADIASFEKDG